MNRFVLAFALFAVPTSFVACDKKGETPPENVTIDDQDLPVPADFAEEAEAIGNDDYKAKLDELETEIDKDK